MNQGCRLDTGCFIAAHLFALGLWGGGVLSADADLRRQQFGNADQVVGDQIEHEVGSDAS